MKKNLILFGFCLLSLLTMNLKGQQKTSLNESNIEGQFQYLISRSEDFEDYKMVKRWILYSFKSHVIDTLDQLKGEIEAYDSIQKLKTAEISKLGTTIEDLEAKLKEVEKEKDSLSLIGMSVQKSGFYSIVIFSLLALVALIVILFVMYKRSNILTVKAKSELKELQDEFIAHRKSALKRHEKVVRELYDEILKYKAQLGQ